MTELDPKQKTNAVRMIAALTSTKLGDALINPKTVLTWLLTQMGASGAVIALLVPVRESGSMLPQLFVSDWVKRFGRRKFVFVSGAFAQALAVAAMGGVALFFPPTAAGIGMLIAVGLFSVARAFCSISGKDVLGKVIPKGARGRVGGVSGTVSGGVSIAAVILLIFLKQDAEVRTLAWLVLGASSLWVLGGLLYSRVEEPAGEPERENESRDIVGRLRLLKDDRLFRRFIIARILLLGSALASPLLVVLAGKNGEGNMVSLGGFVIASGVASMGSSFLWGRLSDRASHLAMAAGGFFAALVGAVALAVGVWSPAWETHPLVWPAMFLLFNIGYTGVRLGRKTWVVDAAKGDRRTDYVSSSNTVIAVAIVVLGAVFSPLQSISALVALGCHSALCVAGGVVALSLNPEKQ